MSETNSDTITEPAKRGRTQAKPPKKERRSYQGELSEVKLAMANAVRMLSLAMNSKSEEAKAEFLSAAMGFLGGSMDSNAFVMALKDPRA